MLSLERTEEGITVCVRLARLIPSQSWFFSFLSHEMNSKSYLLLIVQITTSTRINSETHHMKSTESPATSLLALTNTLHPVVNRCLLGWPVKNKQISTTTSIM
jgi:hypothetical protein